MKYLKSILSFQKLSKIAKIGLNGLITKKFHVILMHLLFGIDFF